MLEKTLESSLDCKEIKPVHPKGNQSWIFIGRTDVEAETSIIWPTDANNWLIWKDPDAGKHGRQKEKRTTEDEIVGWHHQLRSCDGQGSLVCCSPQGRKESDMTEWLNWTDNLLLSVKISLAKILLSWIDFFLSALGFPGGSVEIHLKYKRPPTTQETQVQSMCWEDLLEKGMAIHSSILAWEIPWTKRPVVYSLWGCKSQTQLSN